MDSTHAYQEMVFILDLVLNCIVAGKLETVYQASFWTGHMRCQSKPISIKCVSGKSAGGHKPVNVTCTAHPVRAMLPT